MSGCDRMATPLGTLGVSFAFCLFIAKNVCRIVFINFYFTLFIALSCIYILAMDLGLHTSLISFFLNAYCINFNISGEVTTPQWL